MEKKTVKYHIPQHGIYMYARTNSGKTELIVLNSTDAEQVVANDHYRIMTNDSKSGKELISGKKIDLTKGTFIKYYKISQLIHTQSIAN
ncbi:cyclomaltodextrinase C-terminal domain-containing protein [Phocaeicola vulgatus]|uniref:Cyclo-malto-dextrinase C-terminal domain protein n=2 Tax=Phocaeicola vulgatus TaxID=821 RepID=A0A662ZVV5_PHOVU|nr:cyclomaltodextrinase C-terminal domain-containing protein [Phocaeicola vulgatus]MCQ5264929.1 cyclomaltodextrinase C-terminal domain-containing protein [Phocaeicola vulgatus]MCQ5315976.1 cyclomaltodextrinase C-terminal domain-containing protein [Phocaeicola vulgatus]MCQ5328234.1 cyclomaltodextrinase C-terminal domain-containing protein [Phocaeicola vulgatus]TSE46720.1 cyclo-malto-dextrinase C-terminal domain protein [Phocaeicola vulgatus]TSE51091.1 cyclo-malto-dextrinase C-terminal domain pr